MTFPFDPSLIQAAVAVPPLRLWEPSITKRVTQHFFLCPPPAVFSHVLILSSTANFELKLTLFRE